MDNAYKKWKTLFFMSKKPKKNWKEKSEEDLENQSLQEIKKEFEPFEVESTGGGEGAGGGWQIITKLDRDLS